MDSIFGIIGLICGVYCLYGYYLVQFKKQVPLGILLPKGTDIKSCDDLEGYRKTVSLPLLIFGLLVVAYGATDLIYTYTGQGKIIFFVFLGLSTVGVVLFVIFIRKINKKYFNIK
ncbi:MAG: hypothetical protein LBQ95_01270 [Lachnospiraceae bacterium]|jgi:hypothetical protein|nr:hypothetical protein [Lachnospiraceae bacterium]